MWSRRVGSRGHRVGARALRHSCAGSSMLTNSCCRKPGRWHVKLLSAVMTAATISSEARWFPQEQRQGYDARYRRVLGNGDDHDHSEHHRRAAATEVSPMNTSQTSKT